MKKMMYFSNVSFEMTSKSRWEIFYSIKIEV